MIAGILFENMPAPEDTLGAIYDFSQGQLVVIAPQGGCRGRGIFATTTKPTRAFKATAI